MICLSSAGSLVCAEVATCFGAAACIPVGGYRRRSCGTASGVRHVTHALVSAGQRLLPQHPGLHPVGDLRSARVRRRQPAALVPSSHFAAGRLGTTSPQRAAAPERAAAGIGVTTLSQARSPQGRAPFAFKDSMTHVVLHVTPRIAVRCVLHRCENQDIHC